MTGPQVAQLPDGRLHLNHGPIDLIIAATGPDRARAFAQAIARFQTVLTGLVAELPALRQPLGPETRFADPIAQRMARAVRPYGACFVTPMAAVAGAVADEMLAALTRDCRLDRASVNNGGDVAFHVAPGAEIRALGPTGEIRITASDPVRGLATSGWRGRSHSLGIADSVTVAARSAAEADVAATLIANAVDLPGHPAITRVPATQLSPDSDLGARRVTTDVGPLTADEIRAALARGAALARKLTARKDICAAVLTLRGQAQNHMGTICFPYAENGALADA
jgi:ApbE superfamily uncharacterized protein (UPF0280 family)